MNERAINLAKKLKSLSERGIGGEKENAIAMLQSLMKKHSITMEMINENDAKDHDFVINDDEETFFIQIIANVIGVKDTQWGTYKMHPKQKIIYWINCTPSEAIEIQAKFNFFIKIWVKERDIFYSAFIQTNRLWSKPSGENNDDEKELSREEKEKIRKMLSLMEVMDRHLFIKQIENKKQRK